APLTAGGALPADRVLPVRNVPEDDADDHGADYGDQADGLGDAADDLDDADGGQDDSGDADDPEELGAAPRRPGKFSYRPNLLIVDGGQPQVAAAARALRESAVDGIALIGIAKRLEEVWLPDSDYPVILPRNSDALFLLQRIRDEAHRFAITHQRTRRKRDITSVLTEIPGLGSARVRDLLRHFGSVARLKQATPQEIEQVKGIGPKLAATIAERLSA
ncbi:MAG TPA: helix-hairpin-helix domain-containing protein, partial [Naasia sp.]